jgi:hypothetical protein
MTDVKTTDTRAERLKAALRDNLKRRKAQARGRESATESGEHDTSGPPLAPKEPTG